MNRFLFILSICGIIACVTCNVLVVSGVYFTVGLVFKSLFIVGMLLVFAPAIIKLQKLIRKDQEVKPKGIKGMRQQQEKVKKVMLSFWRPLPLFLKVVVLLVVVYSFANYFLMMHYLAGERGVIENGIYIMESKGKFLRETTREEYFKNMSFKTSVFISHIAVFYTFGMIAHFPQKKHT